MRPLLSILLAPALLAAEDPALAPELVPERKLPAVSLLPDGSVLKKVMIPRYDSKRQLTAVLRTEKMTVVTKDIVEGTNVTVEFFNPDRTPKSRVAMKFASFNQQKGTLESDEPVEIVTDDFTAQGAGLRYLYQPDQKEKAKTGPALMPDSKQMQAFLIGPVKTRLFAKPKKAPATSMNFPTSPRAMAAALMTSLVSLPAMADTRPRLTPEALAAIKADSVSLAPEVTAPRAAASKELAESQSASRDADEVVAAFISQAKLTTIALEPTPPPSSTTKEPKEAVPAPAGAKPLEVKPGPDDTVIEADDGMYYDAEKGLLVYLKNVRLTDPRFSMSGANEVKVFFEKKEPKKEDPKSTDFKATAPKDEDKKDTKKDKAAAGFGGAGGGFGNVDRVVATGAVKILQKGGNGKPPIEASAAVLTYFPKTGELILHGGYPWVKQGDTYMRAKEPDLYLHINQKTNSFFTEGNWDMGGKLDNGAQKPGAAKPAAQPNR